MNFKELERVAVKERSDRIADLLRQAGIHCNQRVVTEPGSRPVYVLAVPVEAYPRAEKILEQALKRELEEFVRSLRFVRQPFTAKDMLYSREPNEAGYYVSGPRDGAAFDESRFELVSQGWDHEHCHVCCAKVEPGDEWWTTHPPKYDAPIGLCLNCYSRLFEI